MKRLLLAILLLMGMAHAAWADGINTAVGSTTTNPRWTVTVFNDSGSTLTHGTVVAWDNDDTEFDRSGYPYVTTTTTADFVWTAGVLLTDSCLDQTLCEMVRYGPAVARIAQSTDAITEDTLVGTTTVAGQVGAFAAAADTCNLGRAMELREAYTGATTGLATGNNIPMWIFVDPSCSD